MSDKGTEIKIALLRQRKTQDWLVEELTRNGVPTSKSELSNVLSGRRAGPKADRIFETANKILH